MYCVYTNTDVLGSHGNWDHVIPLSLGGTNQFVVWADASYNSVVGSVVDGPVTKDLLIAPSLMVAGVKGHSKKPAVPRWRKATIDGRPAQATLTTEGFKIWDAKAGRELDDTEISGTELTLSFSIGAFTALRFLAKVALGGGYFVYGDSIREAIDCDALRKIIMLDVEAAKQDRKLLTSGVQVCDRFHEDSQPGGAGYLYRVACEGLNRSIFITQPFQNGVAFHVGITGTFLGTIFLPGDTSRLPAEGEHEHGHVVLLAPGSMERYSLLEVLTDLRKTLVSGEAHPQADASDKDT